MKDFVPIFFEFDQRRDALLALDTLEELGYKPELLEAERATLHIHLDEQEITSALEIAQSHGGRHVDQPQLPSEQATYAMAYDLEGSIRIPAHTVNEDWSDSYAASAGVAERDALPSDDEAAFDPSADDYNHFSAGIRI
ncbi:hypothetical protein A8709_10135 [Paenibacillus pectinilyticus]|uniref:Uncharacterized protein n=1 Tax=Paenibacillus pectinilyticus TaxID=512399 RepID=A0A1C1A5Y2_9BACL|nr:hypothetical protein [Paenibacillus pectinilyticus]OCT15970.1 hypothetical protein A8709_10135 [Paenibacillus pectinilyticus]